MKDNKYDVISRTYQTMIDINIIRHIPVLLSMIKNFEGEKQKRRKR